MEHFIERKGTQLFLNDQPFFINGFNTYWLMVFAVDPSTRNKVTEVFREASNIGLNACRTWAFNDGGWRALQLSPLVYDENAFKGLDFVVNEARNYNIRLILSLCNNWTDYGGKAQYVQWGKDAGLDDLNCEDDFFSNPTLKEYYKSFVKAVITRFNTFNSVAYKDDPTIIAWELMNEPRCPSDPSGDTLQAWTEEMVGYVKSIDSMHLLEIGVEGYYGLSCPERLQINPNDYSCKVGTDFIRNHKVPGIDFASVHIYSDAWLPESISVEHLRFVRSWMNHHLQDAENLLGMPVVFGEFGVSLNDDNFTFEFRESFIDTVYDILDSSDKKGGAGAGSFLWQLFPEGTEYMDDGYAVIISKHNSKKQKLSQHSKNVSKSSSEEFRKYQWSCKNSSNWKSKLLQKLQAYFDVLLKTVLLFLKTRKQKTCFEALFFYLLQIKLFSEKLFFKKRL